jgi:hypothetical protein
VDYVATRYVLNRSTTQTVQTSRTAGGSSGLGVKSPADRVRHTRDAACAARHPRRANNRSPRVAPDPCWHCRSLRVPVNLLRGSSARKLATALGDSRPPLPRLTAIRSGRLDVDERDWTPGFRRRAPARPAPARMAVAVRPVITGTPSGLGCAAAAQFAAGRIGQRVRRSAIVRSRKDQRVGRCRSRAPRRPVAD